jgi:hypothetical protein
MVTKIIKTEKGEEVIIDVEDYEFIVNNYDLYIDKNGYVNCRKKTWGNKLPTGKLHKILMNPPKGKHIHVDHKDGDKLNNSKKTNLRICHHSQNMKNRKSVLKYGNRETTSIYKGLYWKEGLGVWETYIKNDEHREYLGIFNDEIAAANCYNYYAKNYHGEFAQLNDVPFMDKDEWMKHKRGQNKSSEYRGVSFINGKWVVQICHKGKREIVGKFDDEIEAAIAYDKRAKELKGDKAKLNFNLHK